MEEGEKESEERGGEGEEGEKEERLRKDIKKRKGSRRDG